MKKRFLASVLIGAMMSTTLFGFGTVSANEGAEVDLLVWFCNADNMDKYKEEGLVDRLKEAYPNYNVTVEVIPGTAADFETQYNAAKMSGQAPDVSYLTLTSFASLGTRGEFLQLDEYMAEWETKDGVMQAALDMGRVGDGYGGIGMTPAPVALFYRADMFEAAGLDPEAPPTNWEELAEYAEKLTIKDENGNVVQAGLDIPSIDMYLNVSAPFMLMHGATVVDEVNQEPMLTEPKVIETLEYLYSIYSKGVTLPHDWQKSETIPFLNGIGAMSFLGTDKYAAILADNPDLEGKVRMASPITDEKAAAFCGYRLLTISKDTKNPDAAWDIVEFIMSEEEMKLRVENNNQIPVRLALEETFVAMNPDTGSKIMETVAVGKGAFVVPWVSTLYKYYGPAYEAIMQGIKTPAEAMEEAQEGLLVEIG